MIAAKTSPQWDAIVSAKLANETKEVQNDVAILQSKLANMGFDYTKEQMFAVFKYDAYHQKEEWISAADMWGVDIESVAEDGEMCFDIETLLTMPYFRK